MGLMYQPESQQDERTKRLVSFGRLRLPICCSTRPSHRSRLRKGSPQHSIQLTNSPWTHGDNFPTAQREPGAGVSPPRVHFRRSRVTTSRAIKREVSDKQFVRLAS